MDAVISDIGALIAGVVGLYGQLHPALQWLFAVSFFGWVIIYPVLRFLRGIMYGFY